MRHAAFDRRRALPHRLLAVIVGGILFGTLAVPLNILVAQQGSLASREDVQGNRTLIERAAKRAADQRRQLCEQINDLLEAQQLQPVQCLPLP